MLCIFDAHVHLFDCEANTHAFLEREDPTFRYIIGDYAALPRRYLTDDYLKASGSCRVEGIVWHKFLSSDPVGEARWGQRLADASPLHQSMVVLVDFLDPALEERLEAYAALPNVVAVREHLGWDAGNALRRFAKRPDLLTDPDWREGLRVLRGHGFKCGLEVFAPQLPDLHDVVRQHPDISFTLAVMGWPLDLSAAGYARWRHDLAALSRCANVCAEISAIECIFGMGWHQEQIARSSPSSRCSAPRAACSVVTCRSTGCPGGWSISTMPIRRSWQGSPRPNGTTCSRARRPPGLGCADSWVRAGSLQTI